MNEIERLGKHESIKWTDYYMTMAFLVSTKSKDPSTQCGCVIATTDNRILSIGFNGPPRGFPDEEAVISRPEKYHYWIHAEENALLNYHGSCSDFMGAIAYVTGKPCTRCLRGLIQAGISRIVFQKGRHLKIFDNEPGYELAWNRLALMIRIDEIDIKDSITNIVNKVLTNDQCF